MYTSYVYVYIHITCIHIYANLMYILFICSIYDINIYIHKVHMSVTRRKQYRRGIWHEQDKPRHPQKHKQTHHELPKPPMHNTGICKPAIWGTTQQQALLPSECTRHNSQAHSWTRRWPTLVILYVTFTCKRNVCVTHLQVIPKQDFDNVPMHNQDPGDKRVKPPGKPPQTTTHNSQGLPCCAEWSGHVQLC